MQKLNIALSKSLDKWFITKIHKVCSTK